MGWDGVTGVGWDGGSCPGVTPFVPCAELSALFCPVLPRSAPSCLVLHRCPHWCGACGPSVGGRSGVGVGVVLVHEAPKVRNPPLTRSGVGL